MYLNIKMNDTIFFKNFSTYSLLVVNALLIGLALSSFVENKFLVLNNKNSSFTPQFYQGEIGKKNFSAFQKVQDYNIFTKQEKITPTKIKPKKVDYFPALKKIANDFRLQGTIILGIVNYALIYHKKTRKNKSFQEGKNIFDSKAILQQVKKNSIILTLNDARLELPIEKIKTPNNIITPVTNAKKKPKETTPKNPIAPKTSDIDKKQQEKVLSDLSKAIAEENFIGDFNFNESNAIQFDNNNISVKKDYFQGALKNLPALLNHANAVPYQKNGQFLGYRLTSVKKGGIFDRLGFKKGDIISKVNGDPVQNLSQIMQFFSVLKKENKIAVDIIRETNTFTKNFSLN